MCLRLGMTSGGYLYFSVTQPHEGIAVIPSVFVKSRKRSNSALPRFSLVLDLSGVLGDDRPDWQMSRETCLLLKSNPFGGRRRPRSALGIYGGAAGVVAAERLPVAQRRTSIRSA